MLKIFSLKCAVNMIFIVAQGVDKTKEETIFNILEILEWDQAQKVKTKNVNGHHQVIFRLNGKAVCFVNFISAQKRGDFMRKVEIEFLTMESDAND